MSWVRPSDIAKLVSVSPNTIRDWCKRENAPLPHKKEGGVLCINEDDFWTWWHRDYKQYKSSNKIVDFHIA